MDKNICMYCGKKSKDDLKYRVWKATTRLRGMIDSYRDFCSLKCLVKYYQLALKQEVKQKARRVKHGIPPKPKVLGILPNFI